MKRYKCLIVDNSLATVTILSDYLSQLSFFQQPQLCGSIDEAILLINRIPFDLIFLNVFLLDSSELSLFQAAIHNLPIISTTAYNSSAVNSTNLNIIDCVLKPYDFPRFTRAVNRALDIQSAVEQSIESKTELRVFWENLTADRKRDLSLLFSRLALHEKAVEMGTDACQ